MSFLFKAATPVASGFASAASIVTGAASPMFGRSYTPPAPSFAPVVAQPSFVPPSVSSAVFPSATTSKPPPSFAPVVASKPPPASSTGRKLVAPAPASANAPLDYPPIKFLKGRRAPTPAPTPASKASSRRRKPAAEMVDTAAPAPASNAFPITTGRGTGRRKPVVAEAVKMVDVVQVVDSKATRRSTKPPAPAAAAAAAAAPAPAPVPTYAEVVVGGPKVRKSMESESLHVAPPETEEQELWLKNYEEEDKANKEFLENQKEIKLLQVQQRVEEESGETIDAKTKRLIDTSQTLEERIAKIEEFKRIKREKNLAKLVGIIIAKRDKARATTKAVKGVDCYIPIFEGVDENGIARFIEQEIPPDAISVLDTLVTLSDGSAEEIADFVILKFKSLMTNSHKNNPRLGTLRYNPIGIKSLPCPGVASVAPMVSAVPALLVCEPRCEPAEAMGAGPTAWCCDLRRSNPRVAELVGRQARPYVDANPGIEAMMRECGVDVDAHFRARAASRAAAMGFPGAAAAPAPGGGGDHDDPFPSVVIGGENIVYSIGPIIDAQSILGRPLIMIRIHNYKPDEYPDGIYFWTYPSFSEGGANRIFLMIDGGQFMKGPDYTLTTFILDFLQVHINKYYTKHFVDKQGPGFIPTLLDTLGQVICFFGGMIHLQTQWVHDLIAGRGLNLGQVPVEHVPPGFNRHCYRVSDGLLRGGFKLWFDGGIPDVEAEAHHHTDEVARYAIEFCSMNRQFRDRTSNNSFPLSFCLTTILDKFLDRSLDGSVVDGQGRLVTHNLDSFSRFFKKWPNIFFVQGCHVYHKASPTACVLSGVPSSIDTMRYNPFVEQLSTPEIAKLFTSLRLVTPITTFETGGQFTALPLMSRSGEFLLKKVVRRGLRFAIEESRLLDLEDNFRGISDRILEIAAEKGLVYNDIRDHVIFCRLPIALKKTIQRICVNIFDFPIPPDFCLFIPDDVPPLPANYPLHEKQKVKDCFKKLIGINTDPRNLQSLLSFIISPSVRFGERHPDRAPLLIFDADGEVIVPDSPLDRLRRISDSGIYRHMLMSGILDECTRMSTFPLSMPEGLRNQAGGPLNPQVRCSFLNSDGQYVEVPGGGLGGFGGNYDFSGIFQSPSFRPYVFTATRNSKTFPEATLREYMDILRRVNPRSASFDANIPTKVHTKMFLLRLIFSTSEGAIQIIVCVSSTICVASPGGGIPFVSFGVDVQFNVVSIGPVDTDAHGGNASAHATILATMCEYFSLGCMGSAKKGEYSLTAGYQQFFDYFDNFFRLIMTECFTYVSAYISPSP